MGNVINVSTGRSRFRKKGKPPSGARHRVNVRIEEAIDKLLRYGEAVTVDKVVTNAKTELTWTEYTTEEAIEAVLRQRIPAIFRRRNLSIIDAETFERLPEPDCTDEQFAERLQVKERNARHIERTLERDRAIADFLATKRSMLGRSVTMGEFEEQIEALCAQFEAVREAA